MLHNAFYMFFLKRNKTKQLRKKKKESCTQQESNRNFQRVMVTHYPLRHTTIAEGVCQINCI